MDAVHGVGSQPVQAAVERQARTEAARRIRAEAGRRKGKGVLVRPAHTGNREVADRREDQRRIAALFADIQAIDVFVIVGRQADVAAVKVQRPVAGRGRTETGGREDQQILVLSRRTADRNGTGRRDKNSSVGQHGHRIDILRRAAQSDVAAVEVQRPGAGGRRAQRRGHEPQQILPAAGDGAAARRGDRERPDCRNDEAPIRQEGKRVDVFVAGSEPNVAAVEMQLIAILTAGLDRQLQNVGVREAEVRRAVGTGERSAAGQRKIRDATRAGRGAEGTSTVIV